MQKNIKRMCAVLTATVVISSFTSGCCSTKYNSNQIETTSEDWKEDGVADNLGETIEKLDADSSKYCELLKLVKEYIEIEDSNSPQAKMLEQKITSCYRSFELISELSGLLGIDSSFLKQLQGLEKKNSLVLTGGNTLVYNSSLEQNNTIGDDESTFSVSFLGEQSALFNLFELACCAHSWDVVFEKDFIDVALASVEDRSLYGSIKTVNSNGRNVAINYYVADPEELKSAYSDTLNRVNVDYYDEECVVKPNNSIDGFQIFYGDRLVGTITNEYLIPYIALTAAFDIGGLAAAIETGDMSTMDSKVNYSAAWELTYDYMDGKGLYAKLNSDQGSETKGQYIR